MTSQTLLTPDQVLDAIVETVVDWCPDWDTVLILADNLEDGGFHRHAAAWRWIAQWKRHPDGTRRRNWYNSAIFTEGDNEDIPEELWEIGEMYDTPWESSTRERCVEAYIQLIDRILASDVDLSTLTCLPPKG